MSEIRHALREGGFLEEIVAVFLELKGQLERNSWRGTIAARQLKGRVEYQPADADSPGRVYARLEHLMLPHSAASEIEQLTQQAPVRLPALDIVVQDFELGSRKLGRLEIEAVNQQPSPSQREAGSVWRLEKLNLSSPEARLQASGNWAALGGAGRGGAQRRTALKVHLAIDDHSRVSFAQVLPDEKAVSCVQFLRQDGDAAARAKVARQMRQASSEGRLALRWLTPMRGRASGSSLALQMPARVLSA